MKNGLLFSSNDNCVASLKTQTGLVWASAYYVHSYTIHAFT